MMCMTTGSEQPSTTPTGCRQSCPCGAKVDGPTWPEVVREDTKGQEVSLKVRAYGAIKMMISTDGTFRDTDQGDTSWQDYAMRRTIITNQPNETLYARFQDAEGDESYVAVEGMSYDLE